MKLILQNEDFYNQFIQSTQETFMRSLARGREIGIVWTEVDWTATKVDSTEKNENGKVYNGQIIFSSKGKSYIIKQEFMRYKNNFILTDLLTPYENPDKNFPDKVTAFLSNQIQSKHFAYSETPYKKEKEDSILLKSSSIAFTKEKTLKSTKTQQEFSLLFVKYKNADASSTVKDGVYKSLALHSNNVITIKKARGNKKTRTLYLRRGSELIVLRMVCSGKEEEWIELRNELVAIFETTETIEDLCSYETDHAPPPPPPLEFEK